MLALALSPALALAQATPAGPHGAGPKASPPPEAGDEDEDAPDVVVTAKRKPPAR